MAKTKTKKKSKLKKFAGTGALIEIPALMDIYTDVGLGAGGLGETLMNLGIFKSGGKVNSKYKGCSSIQKQGYGKVLKNKSK